MPSIQASVSSNPVDVSIPQFAINTNFIQRLGAAVRNNPQLVLDTARTNRIAETVHQLSEVMDLVHRHQAEVWVDHLTAMTEVDGEDQGEDQGEVHDFEGNNAK